MAFIYEHTTRKLSLRFDLLFAAKLYVFNIYFWRITNNRRNTRPPPNRLLLQLNTQHSRWCRTLNKRVSQPHPSPKPIIPTHTLYVRVSSSRWKINIHLFGWSSQTFAPAVSSQHTNYIRSRFVRQLTNQNTIYAPSFENDKTHITIRTKTTPKRWTLSQTEGMMGSREKIQKNKPNDTLCSSRSFFGRRVRRRWGNHMFGCPASTYCTYYRPFCERRIKSEYGTHIYIYDCERCVHSSSTPVGSDFGRRCVGKYLRRCWCGKNYLLAFGSRAWDEKGVGQLCHAHISGRNKYYTE